MILNFINKCSILCALFHKRATLLLMDKVLDNKIENVLDSADRMFTKRIQVVGMPSSN